MKAKTEMSLVTDVCEVCEVAAATWRSGLGDVVRSQGPRRTRFLCDSHRDAWSQWTREHKALTKTLHTKSGGLNRKRWQEVFDQFVKEAREEMSHEPDQRR